MASRKARIAQNTLLLLMWAIVFYPLYQGIIGSWLYDSNNSHGILVPFISLFLIWKKRTELKLCSIIVDMRGLFLLFISLVLYIASYAGDVTVAARSMMVFSLMGLVLYNFGKYIFKKIRFPLLFMLFMIPIPVSIVGLFSLPLQRLASDISAALIRMASIPVYQEGNMLYFAQTQLEIAEACSGIHSMMAMLMLGTIFVYLTRMSLLGAVLMIASAIPISMIANIARVTGTGILAHLYGAKVAKGFLHEFSGIAVFFLGLTLMWGCYLLFRNVLKHDNSFNKNS